MLLTRRDLPIYNNLLRLRTVPPVSMRHKTLLLLASMMLAMLLSMLTMLLAMLLVQSRTRSHSNYGVGSCLREQILMVLLLVTCLPPVLVVKEVSLLHDWFLLTLLHVQIMMNLTMRLRKQKYCTQSLILLCTVGKHCHTKLCRLTAEKPV